VDIELQARIERIGIATARAVDEVAGIGDGQPIPAKQPLVDLHLALVAVLPGLIEGGHRLGLCRRLIVDHHVLPALIDPQVVDRARNQQVCRVVQGLDAFEVLPPGIQFIMRGGADGYSVGGLQGMCGARRTVPVEFCLEQ